MKNPFTDYWYFTNVIQQGTCQYNLPYIPYENTTIYEFYTQQLMCNNVSIILSIPSCNKPPKLCILLLNN